MPHPSGEAFPLFWESEAISRHNSSSMDTEPSITYSEPMKGNVFVIDGSIAELNVDAIVNSAHTSLLHCSGISGAIHQSAGPELEKHCRLLGGCAIGDAVMTPGFDLPARWVIHAVAPKIRFGEELNDRHQLTWDCLFQKIVELVCFSGIRSLAIPPVGVGGHRIPADFALPRIAELARAFSENLDIQVFLVSRQSEHRELWQKTLLTMDPEWGVPRSSKTRHD